MAQFSTGRNRFLGNNEDLYEVVMIAGQSGPSVFVPKGNLNASADAFGRLRMSEPHTLFDTSFRYRDSQDRWNSKVTGTGSTTLDVDASLMNMNIGTDSGDEVIRETDRVFGYQPGKSLLSMMTFTMNEPKENLRQRVGYFGKDNGIYFEVNGTDLNIVKRSSSSGSLVESRIAQENWNVDTLDGTGPSGLTLDVSKSQIFWTDIEWLGVGSIRSGFVINGQYIICHIFHHANSIEGTYMTTATLPIRYEITNTGATASVSTMKQICSTVISEGGYNLTGLTQSISTPLTGKNLTNGINNPMVSLRLRSGRTDAIVEPKEVNFYGLQATAFKYRIIRGGLLDSNANWQIGDSDYNVEYDLSATGITGGTVIYEGLFKGQSNVSPIKLEDLFGNSIQLTRKIIEADSTGDLFTIAIEPTTNNDDAIVSLNWQNHTA